MAIGWVAGSQLAVGATPAHGVQSLDLDRVREQATRRAGLGEGEVQFGDVAGTVRGLADHGSGHRAAVRCDPLRWAGVVGDEGVLDAARQVG